MKYFYWDWYLDFIEDKTSWEIILKVAGYPKISIFETGMLLTWCFLAQVFMFPRVSRKFYLSRYDHDLRKLW